MAKRLSGVRPNSDERRRGEPPEQDRGEISDFKPRPDAPREDVGADRQGQSDQEGEAGSLKLTAQATLALAVGTFALAIVGMFQFCAAKRLADDGREQMERAQRAWLMFEGLPLPRTVDKDRIVLAAHFQNRGGGPALNVTGAFSAVIVAHRGDPGSPEGNVKIPETAGRATVGPQATTDFSFDRSNPLQGAEWWGRESGRVLDGSKDLYVEGVATYQDQFGHDRRTTFCERYEPIDSTFRYCSQQGYNDAD